MNPLQQWLSSAAAPPCDDNASVHGGNTARYPNGSGLFLPAAQWWQIRLAGDASRALAENHPWPPSLVPHNLSFPFLHCTDTRTNNVPVSDLTILSWLKRWLKIFQVLNPDFGYLKITKSIQNTKRQVTSIIHFQFRKKKRVCINSTHSIFNI